MLIVRNNMELLSEKGFLHNQSVADLRDVYNFMCTFDDWRLYEVTITFRRQGFNNLLELRQVAISQAKSRVTSTRPEAYILTHELHEDGWSHVHGIVAYHKDLDSHDCLKGYKGRMNNIGIVSVYKCRRDVYLQKAKKGPLAKYIKEKKWENHFEYIIKDQLVNHKRLKDLNYVYIKHEEKVVPPNKAEIKRRIIDALEDIEQLSNKKINAMTLDLEPDEKNSADLLKKIPRIKINVAEKKVKKRKEKSERERRLAEYKEMLDGIEDSKYQKLKEFMENLQTLK